MARAVTGPCGQAKPLSDASTLDDEFDAARARGNEGLMIKDPASRYKPGRRGREWRKLKKALATLDVVVTAVELGHGKRRNVLSDYTFAVRRSEESDELLNVGKAYSGLTDVEIAEMTEWFKAHTIQEFAHGRGV
jgi:DNA ligase-1